MSPLTAACRKAWAAAAPAAVFALCLGTSLVFQAGLMTLGLQIQGA